MATAIQLQQQLREYDEGIAAMRADALGGAFTAMFTNKRLSMKVKAGSEKASALAADVKELLSHVPPIRVPVPDLLPSMPSIAALVNQLRRALAALKSLAKEALQALLKPFMQLLELSIDLKNMLMASFGDIMSLLRFPDLRALFSWMIDLMAPIFRDFIGGIVAALVPILQQLAAATKLLKAIGKTVKAIVKRVIIGNAASFVASNEFNDAACASILNNMNAEIATSAVALAGTLADTAVSVGTAPVHGGGVMTGIATSLAKLLARVASYIKQYKSIQKANLYLEYIEYKPQDRNPVALFEAAPVLGAYYLQTNTISNLMPFCEVGGGAKSTFFSRGPKNISTINHDAAILRTKKKMDPLIAKARELVKASDLILIDKGTAGAQAAEEAKEMAKDAIKEEFKDALGVPSGD